MTASDLGLAGLGSDVAWPDAEAGRARVAGDATALDDLAAWLAGVQGSYPPNDLGRVRALLFGTAHPQAATIVIADLVGAGVQAVAPLSGAVTDGIDTGVGLVDTLVDEGADLLVVGARCTPALGTAAAVAVSVLTDTEPVKVLPRGTVLDPQTWIQQALDVRDRRRAAMGASEVPDDLLEALGDTDLAAITACLLRAAARRTPVLIDGPVAAAAALLAHRVQPRVGLWLRAADRGEDPVQQLAIERIDLPTVLDLRTSGSGLTAGLVAVSVLRAAVAEQRGSADV